MKRKLLLSLSFVMITAFTFVNAQAGKIEIVSIQSPVVVGGSSTIVLKYTSDVPCKLNTQLRETNVDKLDPNWGPWHSDQNLADLPIATDATVTVTYAIPAGETTSAALAIEKTGVQFTFFFQLMPTAGGGAYGYNGGAEANLVNIVTSLGVKENAKKNFAFYPNPANNVLMISSNGLQAKSIKILDMTGKTVKAINNAENVKSIDVSALSRGMYMINTNNNETYKFVKN